MEEHPFLCRKRLHFAEEEMRGREVVVENVEAGFKGGMETEGGDLVS